jgi:hypothetical protein
MSRLVSHFALCGNLDSAADRPSVRFPQLSAQARHEAVWVRGRGEATISRGRLHKTYINPNCFLGISQVIDLMALPTRFELVYLP